MLFMKILINERMVLRVKMKKFPIKECPKCGEKLFAVRQYMHGYGEYYVDMETGEIEATELHNNLTYKNTSNYAVCANCRKRLFKIDDNLNVNET